MNEDILLDKIAEQIWLAHEVMNSGEVKLHPNHISWREQKEHGIAQDTDICYRYAKYIHETMRCHNVK